MHGRSLTQVMSSGDCAGERRAAEKTKQVSSFPRTCFSLLNGVFWALLFGLMKHGWLYWACEKTLSFHVGTRVKNAADSKWVGVMGLGFVRKRKISSSFYRQIKSTSFGLILFVIGWKLEKLGPLHPWTLKTYTFSLKWLECNMNVEEAGIHKSFKTYI